MQHQWEDLTESIYRAAVEPGVWPEVMALMKQCFHSNAETFYFLDFGPRRVRAVHLTGISSAWYRRFDELYFTPDNPWCIHSAALHRPGVIRTNERLARYTRDQSILYRSCYYNEWMRPQGFKYTIGNTLMTEDGTVANVTLMRPPDVPTFSPREVLAFARVSRHFTRALNVAMRLETAVDQRDRSSRAFDELGHGLVIVDPQGRLQFANRAAEAHLRRADGLAVRGGVLHATLPSEQSKLAALFRRVLPDAAPGAEEGPATIALARGRDARPLTISAIRIASGQAHYLASRAAILMTLVDPVGSTDEACERLRRAHALTRAEARLACGLADGATLREAAQQMGITYSTARGYLKILFEKTGTHRQAQLVAQLLRDLSLRRAGGPSSPEQASGYR